MRLLHPRHDHAGGGLSRRKPETERDRRQECARRQSVPLRHACSHRARSHARRRHDAGEAMMNKPFIPSRRDVLAGGGALVVSFSLTGLVREALADETVAPKPLALTAVDSFLAIDSAGLVTIYSGKVDLGTGVRTALTQIAAEELDVPLSKVTIVQGDTALTPDQGPTFGSLAIQIGGVQIRNACAMAKSALLDLAAEELGANAAELKVAGGIIRSGDKQTSYGEL